MMKQRKAWAAVLGVAALGLTGCPGDTLISGGEPFFSIPTEQRPPAGSVLPGSQTPSSGGSTGGGTSGGGTTGPTPTNPTSVSLSGDLRVDALYPKTSQVSVTITNAPKGMLALSAPSTGAQSLTLSWSGQNGLQTLRAFESASAGVSSDQEEKASDLRDRAARYLTAGTPQRQVQAIRTLSKGDIIPLKIDSQSPNISAKVMHLDAGSDGRQRFAILVDTRDESAVFGGSTGTALLDKLAKRLRDPLSGNSGIFKTNRTLFGNDPTTAEATAAGMSIDQEETLFVFSRAVNQDPDPSVDGGENGVLGYFYLGDFASNDPYSNRSKALYLASSSAYDARTSDASLNDLSATIAHELEHLLFSWQRVKAVGLAARGAENESRADAWIDEGLAMYAMAANGFGLESSPGVATRRPAPTSPDTSSTSSTTLRSSR